MKFFFIITTMMISLSAFASITDYSCNSIYWNFSGTVSGGLATMNFDNSSRFKVAETGVAHTLTGRIGDDKNYIVLTTYNNNVKVAESIVPENEEVSQEYKIMLPAGLQLGTVKTTCSISHHENSRAPAVVDDSGRDEQSKEIPITHVWKDKSSSTSKQ